MATTFEEQVTGERAPLPISVMLETTTRCNLRCIMCPKGIVNETVGDMDARLFTSLESLIEQAWELRPVGFGEAFLYRDFDMLLERCVRARAEVSIVTNGTLITERRARLLVERGVTNLIVSIDAVDPELFRSIRVGGELRTVLDGLDRINAVKAETGLATPRIVLQMVGMRSNVHEFPAVIRLAHQMGAERVNLAALTEHDLARSQSLLRDPVEARPHLREGVRLARELGIVLEVAPPYRNESVLWWDESEAQPGRTGSSFGDAATSVLPAPLFPQHTTRPKRTLAARLVTASGVGAARAWLRGLHWRLARGFEPAGVAVVPGPSRQVNCLDPWYTTYVNYKGEVKPCCMSQAVMGDLRTQEFSSIWQGAEYRTFRERLLSETPPSSCRKCAKASWYQPPALDDWIVVGRNDHFGVQLGTGWLRREDTDGGVRWARREAILRLRNTGKPRLLLVLEAWPFPDGRRVRKGEVFVNDVAVGRFRLTRAWSTLVSFCLPAFREPELIVRIVCEREDCTGSPHDVRRIGIGLREARLAHHPLRTGLRLARAIIRRETNVRLPVKDMAHRRASAEPAAG